MDNNQRMPGKPSGNKKPKFFKFNLYWMYSIIAILLIGIYMMNDQSSTKKIEYSEFEKIAQEGGVQKITVFKNNDNIEAILTDSMAQKVFHAKKEELGKNPTVTVTIPSAAGFPQIVKDWSDNYDFDAKVDY